MLRNTQIAKNYLSEDELRELNRIVTMYLDYAEDQAKRRRSMTMADWADRLDGFLQFNERNILRHAGTVTHELAAEHATSELERFDTERRRIEATQPVSDFDRIVAGVKALEATQQSKQSRKSARPRGSKRQ